MMTKPSRKYFEYDNLWIRKVDCEILCRLVNIEFGLMHETLWSLENFQIHGYLRAENEKSVNVKLELKGLGKR